MEIKLRRIFITTIEGQHGPIQYTSCRKRGAAWAGRESARGGQRSIGNLLVVSVAELPTPPI